jgi:hypothetical protein
VVEEEEYAWRLKKNIQDGVYSTPNGLLHHEADSIQDQIQALYKLSSELSTLNLASEIQIAGSDYPSQVDSLSGHGFNQHLIVLGTDDLSRHNPFFRFLFKWSLLDVRVAVVNQIMYTFHRRQMYLVDSVTKESWMWSEQDFSQINPLLKYDYANNMKVMVVSEIVTKIWRFIYLFFVFGSLSIINALFIRISFKCSILLIFPMLFIQNTFTRNPISLAQRRSIYQSMGDIGAISAHFDRHGWSKRPIYMAFLGMMIVYYLMYIACYSVWTKIGFNSTFSSGLNDGYFFYINLTELLTYLFVRTRSSIKYLPKFVLMANMMFLMYINSFMYPC